MLIELTFLVVFFRPPDTGLATATNTPYSTMSRGMESHGYDDTTLSPGRPMNKPYHAANGGYHGMVQGHSNPAMNVEGKYIYTWNLSFRTFFVIIVNLYAFSKLENKLFYLN